MGRGHPLQRPPAQQCTPAERPTSTQRLASSSSPPFLWFFLLLHSQFESTGILQGSKGDRTTETRFSTDDIIVLPVQTGASSYGTHNPSMRWAYCAPGLCRKDPFRGAGQLALKKWPYVGPYILLSFPSHFSFKITHIFFNYFFSSFFPLSNGVPLFHLIYCLFPPKGISLKSNLGSKYSNAELLAAVEYPILLEVPDGK